MSDPTIRVPNCPHCGMLASAGESYCRHCGKPLVAPSESQPQIFADERRSGIIGQLSFDNSQLLLAPAFKKLMCNNKKTKAETKELNSN